MNGPETWPQVWADRERLRADLDAAESMAKSAEQQVAQLTAERDAHAALEGRLREALKAHHLWASVDCEEYLKGELSRDTEKALTESETFKRLSGEVQG